MNDSEVPEGDSRARVNLQGPRQVFGKAVWLKFGRIDWWEGAVF